ncbi:MAG: hypothetical protein JWL65_5919 [Gammaproteobacteria bacterium]|nr:hypothetical protein [Gammaproteobacteria bacterium]
MEHIQSDVSEIKADIRRLDDRIDAVKEWLSGRIDAVDQKLTAKFERTR